MTPDTNDHDLLVRIDERQGATLNGQKEIKGDLKDVKSEVKEIKQAQIDANLAHVECATLQNTRWDGHGDEHDRLEQDVRRKSNIGDAIAVAVASVAAALNISRGS